MLGIAAALDAGIGELKQRRRGLSGGQLLLAMASAQLTGEDHLVGLDRRRADAAGQELEPVSTPASTTAAGIARRFSAAHLLGVEAAVGAVNTEWVSRLPVVRRGALLRVATIDGDATDVEVYGRTKQDAAHAYTGALNLRPHIGYWAEAGVPLAAELMGGAEDPRSNCVDILDRALAALPAGVEQVHCRWVEFAIGAKRTKPLMAVAQRVPRARLDPGGGDGRHRDRRGRLPARPAEAGIACIARRTRIPAERIPRGRARKRRTIPTEQLELALAGHLEAVFGYSFVLTNLDLGDPSHDPDQHAEKLAETEWWYRHRTDIEALNKDAKHGAALRHLPSADRRINRVWMWAALLACAISSWTQELARIDRGNGRGRRSLARFRRELINTPARITRRAGTLVLRLPPGDQLLADVLPRLQLLPNPG